MTIHRRAWTMELTPGSEAAYEAAHAAIWPEMLDTMRDQGITRFAIFRHDLTLFAYQERSEAFPDTGGDPPEITRRWWAEMAPLMVTETDNRPRHTPLNDVFFFDGKEAK